MKYVWITSILVMTVLLAGLPAQAASNALFDRYIAIGDSLTHGFQSGAVDETRQPTGWAAKLARQMNTGFEQPMLKFPGYLVNIEDLGKGNISWWQYYYPLAGGKRVDNYGRQAYLNNFGITGSDVTTMVETKGDEGFYKLVLGKGGAPAITQALNKNPTFITLWAGNNDVLGCALGTTTSSLTPQATFRTKFNALVSRIKSQASIRGVAIANIPDVTAIAYLAKTDDPDVPRGSLKAFWNTDISDGDEVLDPSEVALLKNATVQFNNIIRDTALANGWAYVDANAVFNDIVSYGYELKRADGKGTGRYVNNTYLGGIFSLDGVHPSVTGHAIVANFFIDAINSTYGTALVRTDEYAASESDSLYKKPYDPRKIINSWYGRSIQFMIEMFI